MKYIALTLTFLIPMFAHAATASFVLPSDVVHEGDEFAVEVFLDTEQNLLNAIEGSVQFSETLEFKEVRYAGSVISLWLSAPSEREPGTIDFAGLVPGGFQVTPEKIGRGNLFTLVFKAAERGTASVLLGTDAKAYLNDGEGTSVPLASTGGVFTVATKEGEAKASGLTADVTSPEEFVPRRESGEPYAMEGRILVFNATDKDSGVSRYEIARSYIGFLPESMLSWELVSSPYALDAADAWKYLYIRASDTAGNARIEVVSPEYAYVGIGALIVIVALLFGLLYKLRHRVVPKRALR